MGKRPFSIWRTIFWSRLSFWQWLPWVLGASDVYSLFIVLTATLRTDSSCVNSPSITEPNSPDEETHSWDATSVTFISHSERASENSLNCYSATSTENLTASDTSGKQTKALIKNYRPSPSVFPSVSLCLSTITSCSFCFSSSLMPRLFTDRGGKRGFNCFLLQID